MHGRKKIIDRMPETCAAGIATPAVTTVESLFKDYSKDNFAEYMIRDLENAVKIKNPVQPYEIPFNKVGVSDSLRISSPRIVNREIFDPKDCSLGKIQPTYSKPDHITNENTTFGIASDKHESSYDVIFPNKNREEVLRESQKWHAQYVFTHCDYNPSEQINRNYDTSTFNCKAAFGINTNSDRTGKRLKRAMTTYNPGKVCFLRTLQKSMQDRRKAPVGKSLKKTSLPRKLPSDYLFGRPITLDKYIAKDLVGYKNCPEIETLYVAIAHIKYIRVFFKNRRNLWFEDVKNHYNGDPRNESCPLDELWKVLDHYKIPIKRNKAIIVANHFKLIDNKNNINYEKFVNLFDLSKPFPEIINPYKFEPLDHQRLTTYRAMSNDLYNGDDLCNVEPAGLSSLNVNGNFSSDYRKIDLSSLGNETNVKMIISPPISAYYGLSHRDYLLPRSEDEIQAIFSKIIANLNDDLFKQIWENAKLEYPPDGNKVSIEVFLHVLKKMDIFNRKTIKMLNKSNL